MNLNHNLNFLVIPQAPGSFQLFNPVQHQLMAAMMAGNVNAPHPLAPNFLQEMLAQQIAAQVSLRLPNTPIAPTMPPNMFINPLLMQAYGLGGVNGAVPGGTSTNSKNEQQVDLKKG